MKILIVEEGKPPVTIETDKAIVTYGSNKFITNMSKDELISSLMQLTFLAVMQNLPEETND